MLRYVLTTVSMLLLCANAAMASPLFQVGDGTANSWSGIMQSGQIVQDAISSEVTEPVGDCAPYCVTPAEAAGNRGGRDTYLVNFYLNTAINKSRGAIGFVPVSLYPDIPLLDPQSNSQQPVSSLVATYSDFFIDPSLGISVLPVAAWRYDYPVDPDLTGTALNVSMFLPTGTAGMGLELIDASGLTRGWYLESPATGWAQYSLLAGASSLQGPFTYFGEDAGFDITSVASIRMSVGADPALALTKPPVGGDTYWAAYGTMSVTAVPEPGTIILIGSGLVGLGFVRRRVRA